MPSAMQSKKYDLGYTGKLCTEYITTNLPTDLNWAIAGRSEAKLSILADEFESLNGDRTLPGQKKWHP